MQFLYPSFLWALLALAIPVIIHLFYFRRFKKVYFTNVKFLKEIKEETSSRNKLKNLLILLMRCLAIAGLVFAFAQPFIPSNSEIKKGEKSVSIYIDNSFSLKAEKENIPLIDLAKERARKIVNAYSEEDRFQILTNDFEGKHQRLVSKEEALAYIEEVNISPAVQPISKVINRQKQLLKSENKISFLISDFQKSTTDIRNYTDTLMELNLLPIQHSIQKNVSIDSVWFEAPTQILNQTTNLIVKFTNHDNNPVEGLKASLWKDGQEKPIGLLDMVSRGTVIDTVAITILKTGIHEAEIRINDFPVQFDDKFYFSFKVKENVNVLSINQNGPNSFLTSLFNGISYFKFENSNLGQVQFQKFKDYDLILLNELKTITSGFTNEIKKYIEQGGKVFVVPSAESEISNYNAFLSTLGAPGIQKWDKTPRVVSQINTQDFIFSDVYEKVGPNLRLPETKSNFVFNGGTGGSQNLLTYRDGTAFLTKHILGDGQFFVCASTLNIANSNLVANGEVFVPMLYKMSSTKNRGDRLSYSIGVDQIIEVENKKTSNETIYKLKGQTEFIPSQIALGKKVVLDVKGQVKNDGYYDLILQDRILDKLAFNYNRKESNLDLYTPADLKKIVNNDKINIVEFGAQEGMKEFVGEKDQGTVLWKWFLIASLLFLLLEVLIIRFLKN
jgi:hypothetical protein